MTKKLMIVKTVEGILIILCIIGFMVCALCDNDFGVYICIALACSIILLALVVENIIFRLYFISETDRENV